jgi:tripartite-type tricarboxylate transporter receptor subunit TctC
MTLPRRRFLHLAGGAAAFPVVSRVVHAQTWPTRPVRMIVGFPPGGTADIVARLLGQWLSPRLGQPFVIENRPGAATNIATEAVVRAAPDGHTLLVVDASPAINATLYDNLDFVFLRDIVPVAAVIRTPNVMEVTPSFPARTVPEFIAYAKAHPDMITMASGGTGSVTHLVGELFEAMASVRLIHVPYRGALPALTDVMSGQAQVTFNALTTSIEYIKAGTVRPLAVTTAERSGSIPGVPTLSEFVPGYEASAINGICAPRNTPPDIIETLNRQINAALADPQIKARFADLGSTGVGGSAADYGRMLAAETEKWARVIRAANIKLQ